MGQSTDIKDKEANDAKFREYMNARRQDGDKIQKELVVKLKEQINTYYKETKFDHSPYLANEYQEFQNTSKWSLENINKIIGAVAKVLLGESKDSKDVKGAEPKVVAKIGEGAAALVANQQLVVARVFDAVASILGTFDVVSETKRVAKQEHFPVLAGLHLFLSVSNETFKSTEFFTSEYINQLNICYEVHFSEGEAARAGLIDSATQYFDQIVVFNNRLKELNVQLAASKTADEFTKLESFIANFERRRDAAQEQLDKINKARSSLKAMALNTGVETAAPRLRGPAPALHAPNANLLRAQAGNWPDAPLL
ncbi:hypothetical protein [Polaromonas sp. YR568]|uniref:hypothetical protein n=1 Tax=Polaromonas sp. YR568 TaxID=1855301 RepID=UPI00398BDA16